MTTSKTSPVDTSLFVVARAVCGAKRLKEALCSSTALVAVAIASSFVATFGPMSATPAFAQFFFAETFGGNGGPRTGGTQGGTGGGYGQNGGNGDAGTTGGGGGGPGAVATTGGAGGNASGGIGGSGGVNGSTGAAVPGGSATGTNGGNALPSPDTTNQAGGGGGAGGYGLVLTTAGPHATTAGQAFTGGNGGAANGNTSPTLGLNNRGGVGGDGGGGVFLQVGGTFTNAQGASLTGGKGGASPTTHAGGVGFSNAGFGLVTTSAGSPVAATVINAGTITGGAGGDLFGATGPDLVTLRFSSNGGGGIAFLGGGSLNNTATGVIIGGTAGLGFAGTATQQASSVGLESGAGIFSSGGGSITNDGQVSGGAGVNGTVAAPGSVEYVTLAAAAAFNVRGSSGGAGVSASGPVAIVNNATGTISGGNGGNGGSGFNSGIAVAGNGGQGGHGIDIGQGSILNYGQILGGNAGNAANATTAGQAGGGLISPNQSFLGLGGNAVTTGDFTSTGALSVDNRGTIVGGKGANGGTSGAGGAGGNGNAGGAGVLFAMSAGNAFTILNSGTITGGNGGVATTGTTNGTTGAGGAGMSLQGDGTVTTSGTISGGLSGDGATRANAITFLSGVHTLTLQTGATFTGNVVVNTTAPSNAGVSANNTLNLDGASTGMVSLPQFQNFGHLTQTGGSGGAWTLTGNGTFSSDTTVSAGTIALASGSTLTTPSVTVQSGGTLGGSGTVVGNLTVNNGGTLSPGNSIGTLMVQGNLVLTAAASYLVEVSPTSADRTNVTGTAALGGATVKALFAPGTYVARQYTIVNATGGINGTFNGPVNTNLPAGFQSSLSYDAKNAFLNLTLNFASAPTGSTGLNINQTNVANALSGFFNRTGGIPMIFGALTPAGLTQGSGEIGTGTQQPTINGMNLFLGTMTDPFIAGRGAGVASASPGAASFAEESLGYARKAAPEKTPFTRMFTKAPPRNDLYDPRWSIWAAGFGGSQTSDGQPVVGSNTATSSVYGVAAGADYRLSPNTIAGFALAGGGTNFRIANNLGRGSSDLFQAGAFVRHQVGAVYVSAALAYGWQDVTTDRTVTIAGPDRLQARFDTNTLAGRIEGGYRYVMPWVGGIGLTPYAAGQVTAIFLPSYAERVLSGANTFALTYGSRDVTTTRGELGLRSDKSWAFDIATLTLRGRAAWAHNFDPDRSISATFQTLPGASFVVNGAAQTRNTALVSASAEMAWRNNWSTSATFEGEFSDRTRSYAGKGLVRYIW